MVRKVTLSIAVLLAFSAVVVVGTLAVFTDSKAIDSNAFDTGTISLGVSPTTAAMTFSNMLPGDATAGTALTVTNNTGSSALRYAVTSSATNTDAKDLRNVLVLDVKTKDTNTSACTNFNGTSLYSAALDTTVGGSGSTLEVGRSTTRALRPLKATSATLSLRT